jgi:hypothetical protein
MQEPRFVGPIIAGSKRLTPRRQLIPSLVEGQSGVDLLRIYAPLGQVIFSKVDIYSCPFRLIDSVLDKWEF